MRTRRAWSAVAVAAVLVATACSGGAGEGDATPSATDGASGDAPSAGAAPSAAGTPAPDAADPAYAVAPPGKRRGPVTVADVLVSGKGTLSEEVVQRVRDLEGVESVDVISLANVPLENKVYNLAAVDPATYRLFTGNADFADAWRRVAGGEMAVSTDLVQRLPRDDQDFVDLDDTPAGRVHVGALVEQAGKIDLVVNAKRGEALGMTPGNALLVHTGRAAPEALRGPIQQALGGEASVQNLDAVARFGLDPDAFESAVLVGDFADAVGVFNYTPAAGGRITPDPVWVSSHIVTETVPILGSVTCNKYLMPQLKAALAEVVTRGLEAEIDPDQYAGCYYPRYIAGSTTLSNHSFGLALDLNTPGNQRGTVGEMNREVVSIFKYWGFAWGGDWGFTDPMHFELAQLKAPG
ncbi:M15 family metallopeptidase [Nocardioides litoris]|uniref:M15 family metallopeptidase n=1 Tax=Nocardioides litoris TaxID=1926648 RepID=UPI00111D9951|nr:M15 family metallopeptidase [Nocardioides litoris]